MTLLAVGSMAFDTIRSPFGRVERAVGGSATYFSLAASPFSPVRLVSVVGADFPRETLDLLASRGVDLAGVAVTEGETFRWEGYYEYDLNTAHTVKTELNVFSAFSPVLPEAYRDSAYVFLGNIDPRIQIDLLDQVRKPRLVALDTMNYWIGSAPERVREAMARVDVVIVNEGELRELSGEYNLVRAAREVMSWGPGRVVVKRGEYGVLHVSGDHLFAAPAYPLESIFDPTGAGDSFAGGFMGYLASRGEREIGERDWRAATVYGSAVASFTVEAFGTARLEGLSAEELSSRLAAFRHLTEFHV